MITSIPICFYPMRKLFLDDDQAFSQSILLKMHDKNSIAYHSPHQALHYLLNEYQPEFSKSNLIDSDSALEITRTRHTVSIHIENLKNMFNKAHHQDISVICVDYHMPEMCGLDFLKKISHLPVKKALITGEKDFKIGLNAFNQGLVDVYIRKDEPEFPKKIQNTVTELEWKYFVDFSSFVLDLPEFNYLKNEDVISVFKQFIADNHISSFCLTDIQGTFIARNQKGEVKHIIVKSKKQLQELSLIAKEDGASNDIVYALEQGKVIPFFDSKEYWQIPAKEWSQYFVSANRLNNSNMMWATI